MGNATYCKLYVDFDGADYDFLEMLANQLGTDFKRKYDDFISDDIILYSLPNDDYCPPKKTDPIDGFLFFKQLIEIECKDNFPHDTFVGFIAGILNMFWEKGIEAVATAFEDELPDHGGYFGKIISHKK